MLASLLQLGLSMGPRVARIAGTLRMTRPD